MSYSTFCLHLRACCHVYLHNVPNYLFCCCWCCLYAFLSFFLQVTLGVFLIKAPLAVWAVWAGMGVTWLVVFVVHECVYVCCKIAHRGQKVY